MFVYPKDVDRLARSLELDVLRHGGRTISNENGRALTFKAPKGYLERMQTLTGDPSAGQPNTPYALWVGTVMADRNHELRRAAPDTVLRVNLRMPLAAHNGTLPMLAVTGGIIVATLLGLLVCAIVYEYTKQTR